MRHINRRESPRIEIRLRCHVTSPAIWMRNAMYTENISRNGLLMAWRGEHGALPLPSPGQIITVEVELPALHDFGQKCIHCQGIVTRITGAGGERPLVALRLNYMDFRSFHDRVRSMNTVSSIANSWMA